MRYLVVLDERSAIGSIYAAGNNDGFVTDSELEHPVLDCMEISLVSPYYLFAKRDLSDQGGNFQSLHIPHSSIVAIYQYADEGSRPFGFVAQKKADS